jgi:hypothetical protein
MNRLIAAGLFSLVVSTQLAAGESFLEVLPPAESKAAGLDKLTPEERNHLGALVEAYKNNTLTASERATAKSEAVPPTNESSASKSKGPGLLAKAKVLLPLGTQVEYGAIKSTIPGKFQGWDGRTVFTLANGQRWQVANGGSYYTRSIEDIEVEITPATLGGFWMSFPTLKAQVRVKLVSAN